MEETKMKKYWTDFITEDWVIPGTEVERLTSPIIVYKENDVKKLIEENEILKDVMGDIAHDDELYWSDIRDLARETLEKVYQ